MSTGTRCRQLIFTLRPVPLASTLDRLPPPRPPGAAFTAAEAVLAPPLSPTLRPFPLSSPTFDTTLPGRPTTKQLHVATHSPSLFLLPLVTPQPNDTPDQRQLFCPPLHSRLDDHNHTSSITMPAEHILTQGAPAPLPGIVSVLFPRPGTLAVSYTPCLRVPVHLHGPTGRMSVATSPSVGGEGEGEGEPGRQGDRKPDLHGDGHWVSCSRASVLLCSRAPVLSCSCALVRFCRAIVPRLTRPSTPKPSARATTSTRAVQWG
jgi:hypothetical protein